MSNDLQHLTLDQAATHLLEECRMVLPGIQALFGFQLIAVFNQRFAEKLSATGQRVHLVAILCVVVSIALVMTPAALHRHCEPQSVSRRFLELSSRLLMWGMVPLALGTALDAYLVSLVILNEPLLAGVIATGVLGLFGALWMVLPAHVRLD